ncbi:hypothetical protein [Streptomyces sp. NPDC005017]|uniref:hypothetical protein n=1 Tax=Streptomyces sp. NPDC005017 TaxID=3364706 RepID=UPI0036A12B71
MNDLLEGLAANPSPPTQLVARLIAPADDDVDDTLAGRPDLGRAFRSIVPCGRLGPVSGCGGKDLRRESP